MTIRIPNKHLSNDPNGDLMNNSFQVHQGFNTIFSLEMEKDTDNAGRTVRLRWNENLFEFRLGTKWPTRPDGGDVFDVSGVHSVTVGIDGAVSEAIQGNNETNFHFETSKETLDVLKAISEVQYFPESYTIQISAELWGSGAIGSTEFLLAVGEQTLGDELCRGRQSNEYF